MATVAPRCTQDRKRDEKMSKLVAPRGPHRGLKIVIFGFKFKQNAKKATLRTYLSKPSILVRFWLDLGLFLIALVTIKIMKSV